MRDFLLITLGVGLFFVAPAVLVRVIVGEWPGLLVVFGVVFGPLHWIICLGLRFGSDEDRAAIGRHHPPGHE